jgi:hypothetical protein
VATIILKKAITKAIKRVYLAPPIISDPFLYRNLMFVGASVNEESVKLKNNNVRIKRLPIKN